MYQGSSLPGPTNYNATRKSNQKHKLNPFFIDVPFVNFEIFENRIGIKFFNPIHHFHDPVKNYTQFVQDR